MKALAMLPPVLIRPAFEVVVGMPPDQQNPNAYDNLLAFRQYFRTTWLDGRYSTNVWCHWDNTGPRTTNHAEGYHSRLNRTDLRDNNLAMKNFLHLLQPMHNRDCIRVRQLRQFAVPSTPRHPTYVALDARIETAKQNLLNACGDIWNIPDFAIEAVHGNDFQRLMFEIHTYLRYMRHMIGKKTRVVLNPV